MKKHTKKLAFLLLIGLTLLAGQSRAKKANALDITIPVTDEQQNTKADIPIANLSQEQRVLNIGDSGNLLPIYTEEDIRLADEEEFLWNEGYDENDSSWYQPTAVFSYENQNDAVVTVDGNGHFQVVGVGSSTILITGTTGYYNDFFSAECQIIVYPDMTKVRIKTKKLSGVIVKTGTDDTASQTPHASFAAEIESDFVFDGIQSDNFIPNGYDSWDSDWENEDWEDTDWENSDQNNIEDIIKVRLESSNKKMKFGYKLENNVVHFTTKNAGTTTLTFYLNEKPFSFQVTVHKVKMKKNSYILGIKEIQTLNVKTDLNKLDWKSSDPKTVYVTRKGVMQGRREGNVLLTAKIGDTKLACLVSCVSPQKKLAAAYARKMSETSEYSQEKRMQKGYYDCSSLVWRSYAKAGKYLAVTSYAPTAADLAKWCNQTKRRIKGGFSIKNVTKLNLLPGDLMFQGGADNGRYRGIYHVEMFTGYRFYGLDSSGNPLVSTTWGARPDNYYWPGASDKMDMMARP